MTRYFGARCFGCDYFEGDKGVNGALNRHTPVNCKLGISASVGTGCSRFKPDITASCTNCIYLSKTKNFYVCERGHSLSVTTGYKSYCFDCYWKEQERGGGKGGCFISTAVCQSQNLPDDCFELETLRNFRDNQLMNDDSLKELVYQYYEVSPKLVQKVECNLGLSQYLFNNHIKIIVEMIDENKDKQLIVEKYRQMVDFIAKY